VKTEDGELLVRHTAAGIAHGFIVRRNNLSDHQKHSRFHTNIILIA